MGDLSRSWSWSEFQAASRRPLTAADRPDVLWWVERLQQVTDALGPCRLTSWWRPGDDGAHGSGDAVDLVPLRVDLWTLADWLAVNSRRLGLVQVIQERNHAHAARRLVRGARGGYLAEYTDGEYTPTAPDPSRIPAKDYRLLLAGGAGAAILLLWLAG